LKGKGWVNSLRAGSFHPAAGFDAFKITMDLTPEGLGMSPVRSRALLAADISEHYEDVAMAIFKYTSLLRATPPTEEVFNEIKAISDISFRFAERGKTIDYANGLATWIQAPVPREKILSAKYLVEEFIYDELASALQMLDPRRATIGVTCRELPKSAGITFDKTEPIYGTEYCEKRLGEAFMKEVRDIPRCACTLLKCRLLLESPFPRFTCLDPISSFPTSSTSSSGKSRILLYDPSCSRTRLCRGCGTSKTTDSGYPRQTLTS